MAYKDRSAVLDPLHAKRPDSGHGIFYPTMVLDGQVVGTWKRTLNKGSVGITHRPFTPLGKAAEHAFARAARRYVAFLAQPPEDRRASHPVS